MSAAAFGVRSPRRQRLRMTFIASTQISSGADNWGSVRTHRSAASEWSSSKNSLTMMPRICPALLANLDRNVAELQGNRESEVTDTESMDSYTEVRRVRKEMSERAGHEIRALIASISDKWPDEAALTIDPGTKVEQCDATERSKTSFVSGEASPARR